MSELDGNKRVAIRWLDLVSEGDVELICRCTAPTWRLHGGPPDLPEGHDGVRALFGHIGPIEQKWTIDDVIAEGDLVVVRATNSCTQDETWRNADDLGRLLQLGARIEPGNA
jgi:predicted SnoaL-like aldol condensation-catalyzing enzyme